MAEINIQNIRAEIHHRFNAKVVPLPAPNVDQYLYLMSVKIPIHCEQNEIGHRLDRFEDHVMKHVNDINASIIKVEVLIAGNGDGWQWFSLQYTCI
jgi:hypothetical protein